MRHRAPHLPQPSHLTPICTDMPACCPPIQPCRRRHPVRADLAVQGGPCSRQVDSQQQCSLLLATS